jgi:hypothetical protein
MKKVLLIIISFLFFSFSLFSQSKMGLDIGQPINPITGAINLGSDTSIIGPTCTNWVRVNFILGPWSSPTDSTLYNGKTWAQTYGEIIDKFVARGIKVYGLIGTEAYNYPAGILEQYPGSNSSLSTAWINGYTANFVSIVNIFKNRVRVFESYNEPNNWTNSNTAIVHPAWFSLMLQEIYLNTKYFAGHNLDTMWQVTLVSGALFTFDLNTGGQYINDTYWYGKNVFAWDWTHQQTGSYPLDGFGQHIYVEQASSNVTAVTNAINTNLNDFWNNIYIYETDPNKKIWISEFGWESNVYGQTFQSNNLTTGFNVFQNDVRVGLALWFTLSDFPGGDWGLYLMGNFQAIDQKTAYTTFKNMQTCPSIMTSESEMENSLDGVSVFPNPFEDEFTVVCSSFPVMNISLFTILGKEVGNCKLDSDSYRDGKNSMKPGDLPAGIYFLQIKKGSEILTKKLVKK